MQNQASRQRTGSKQSVSHSAYTALKRLIHTAIMGAAVALIICLFIVYEQYQSQWLSIQTDQPGKSVSQQYAKIIAPALSNDDITEMESLIAIAMSDPAVMSVSIFDSKGKYIAPLPRGESVVTITRENPTPPVTYLEVIQNSEGQALGYLNVNIDANYILDDPLTLRQQQVFIAMLIIALALIVGVYITRGFYKFRPWLTRVLQANNKLTQQP